MSEKRVLASDDPWAEDGKSVDKTKSPLSHFNNPAYITLVLTVIFYLIVSTYYINFFNRLSLPFYSLNLPLAFYLNAGYEILLITAVFLGSWIIYYISFWRITKERSIYFRAAWIIMILVSIIFIICIVYYLSPVSLMRDILFAQSLDIYNFIVLIVMFMPLFLVMIFSLPLKIIKNFLNKNIEAIWPMIYVLIIIIILILPMFMGRYAAEDLISGKRAHYEVNLSLEGQNTSIEGKNFILITQCNGNYYLIEKSNPAPEDASTILYIIPEIKFRWLQLEGLEASARGDSSEGRTGWGADEESSAKCLRR